MAKSGNMSELISSSITSVPSHFLAGQQGPCSCRRQRKGGSGKSTAAIHLAIGLLQKYLVATIDLDYRKGLYALYRKSPGAYIERTGKKLFVPEHHVIPPSTHDSLNDIKQDERNAISRFLMI